MVGQELDFRRGGGPNTGEPKSRRVTDKARDIDKLEIVAFSGKQIAGEHRSSQAHTHRRKHLYTLMWRVDTNQRSVDKKELAVNTFLFYPLRME